MDFASKLLLEKRLWLAAVAIWIAILFLLPPVPRIASEETPQDPTHVDKILNFTYFFGGAFALATYLLLANGTSCNMSIRVIVPLVFFSVMGALHEYHQSFTPGRSGNDVLDWLADVLGAIFGIIIANRFHPLFLKFSSSSKEIPEI